MSFPWRPTSPFPLPFEICCLSKSCGLGCSEHVLNKSIWGEEEKQGKTMIAVCSLYLTSTWVLSSASPWLLYQGFCKSRVLETGFLMEHGGKLRLQLGSTKPLKPPKLPCFDSLAGYSISSPVSGPGDVVVQYSGLRDLAGCVSQRHFCAAA